MKQKFESCVNEREPISSGGYFWFVCCSVWTKLCRCCCRKSDCVNRRVRRYKKFTVAQARLSREHDLRNLIEFNRVTLAIQKATLREN